LRYDIQLDNKEDPGMKKSLYVLVVLVLLLTACGTAVVTPIPTEEPPTPTATPTEVVATEEPTASPVMTPTPPAGIYGPTNFPADVDPLTGLVVANPALLNRRPLAIKVSNLPRTVRPQWGLSLADIVFEYYTEEASTRFTAIFLGNDAEIVGPIRSARFLDGQLVRGYKAVFAFGSAYEKVLNRLFGSEFADRLVLEGQNSPLYRYDPSGYDYLMVDTAKLSDFITQKGVENGRQNLDGMFFQPDAPAGQTADQFFVRFSAAIYNNWQYDASMGKYLRFSDTASDFNGGQDEKYAQVTDRLTGQPLAFDNVVVIYVLSEYYNINPEVMDIQLLGSGTAYAFRDGQVYQVQWQRSTDSVVSLVYPDGSPYPFKPGNTWFEVIGKQSTVEQTDQGLRFVNIMP
jgi:Protein of unknown function (DUF3048) N-terminal domain/Protein of unknown function (DUF3048) C-terminal domain